MLNERIDTGFRDLAGNIIYVGSTLSDPTFERAFDCYPGIVKIDDDDDDDKFYVRYQSMKNKNGGGIRCLCNSVAKKSLVIEGVPC